MERFIWENLTEGDNIDVRYVPDAPDINEVITGRVVGEYEQESPLEVYGVTALGFVFSLFLLGVATMSVKGIDIDFDSETKKFRIKRLGDL